MYVATGAEMRQIDQAAINDWLVPEIVLMENAAAAAVNELSKTVPGLADKKVVILAGCGNNGGDGLAIARHLHNKGVTVKVFLLSERNLSSSAEANLAMLEKLPVKIYKIDNEKSTQLLQATLNYEDIIIDAIYGTGLSRELSPLVKKVLSMVNKRDCLRIAIDMPSGLHSESGQIMGYGFKADYTFALALPKLGYYIGEGSEYTGKVRVCDINISPEVVEKIKPKCQNIDDDYLKKHLKERLINGHKGSYGHLLIIGGSLGMSGAVVMAAKSAWRSGVGLVTALVPKEVQPIVAVSTMESMIKALPAEIPAELAKKSAVVIGPGLGQGEEAKEILRQTLISAEVPVLIDADGLNLVAKDLSLLHLAENVKILTPHPGEMARLCGTNAAEIENNRLEYARMFASEQNVWVVLKGTKTLIASPSGEIWFNTVASPALSAAGSGDVLSGIIGALLAQGYSAEEACLLGVNIHGRAGRVVEKNIGATSAKAGDIIDALSEVIRGEMHV